MERPKKSKMSGAPKPEEIISLEQMTFSIQTNPLLIDTVLRSLFSVMEYELLKDCRQVCRKWKEFSDPELIKRSAFVVRKKETTPESFWESPRKISSIFQSMNPQVIKFTGFKFGIPDLNSALREIYLEPNLPTMLQLEVRGGIWFPAELVDDNADKLIGQKLIKLKLSGPWIVSLGKLSSIRHIDLSDCTIVVPSLENVSSVVKMRPQELKLSMCKYIPSEEIGSLAQIIDFSTLQKLELYYRSYNYPSSYILNLSDCANIKILRLSGMNINMNGKLSAEELILTQNAYKLNEQELSEIVLSNYISSNVKISKLVLKGIRENENEVFKFDNSLLIDELEIQEFTAYTGLNAGTHIKTLKLKVIQLNPATPDVAPHQYLSDLPQTLAPHQYLSDLPQTLGYLEIHTVLNLNCFVCSDSKVFPNLKHLFLKGHVNIVPYFQNCPSLLYVQLEGSVFSESRIFDVDYLPPNIKGLSIKNASNYLIVKGSRNLKLDVLLLNHFDFNASIRFFQSQVSKKIQVDLVIFQVFGNYNDRNYENFITRMKNCQSELPQINLAFGPVYWRNKELNRNSSFSNIVDKKSEYYLFDRGTGRGLSKFEFLKMLPFEFCIKSEN